MSIEDIGTVLHGYFVSQNGFEDPSILRFDTNLFDAGLLDSLGTAALVTFCEERFDCQLDLAELTEENISSIQSIAEVISRAGAPSS